MSLSPSLKHCIDTKTKSTSGRFRSTVNVEFVQMIQSGIQSYELQSMDVMPWKPLFSLILLSVLLIHEDWLLSPSCQTLTPFSSLNNSSVPEEDDEEELKVMMFANLLLWGSESAYLRRVFRDNHTSRFFAFKILEPDSLVVLGDVTAKGSEMSKSKWFEAVRELHGVLGPSSMAIPLHVVLGERYLGRCSELRAESVDWITAKFPRLDAAACAAFEIGNVSFVSINSVALLCPDNDFRLGVERVIESESAKLRLDGPNTGPAGWRGNTALPRSGPVVLLHFPTKRDGSFDGDDEQSLPANLTEYIFHALKPGILFTGHSDEFSVYAHEDGTYEVAVPATSWNVRDDPAFIVAVFRRNSRDPSITHCILARESRVIQTYTSLLALLLGFLLLLRIYR